MQAAMQSNGTLFVTRLRPELVSGLARHAPGVAVELLNHAALPGEARTRAWFLVDWLLPETSGLELCRRLREAPHTAHGHITMVLDEDDSDARRRALKAGADDYILEPFSAEVLMRRLDLSRVGAASSGGLAHGELVLDPGAQQARWQGRLIVLRPNEFRLLAHFIAHPNRLFSRAALIAQLGKHEVGIDERTVDVWVGRLRRALRAHGAPDPLRTVRSMGYVLDSI